MVKRVKLKCLRCGYEYIASQSENLEPEERTCPRCRSNSVRLIRDEQKSKD
jgi:Zn finger protein HypA/HybF involved in hydrogenase expression